LLPWPQLLAANMCALVRMPIPISKTGAPVIAGLLSL
jgi:hypothetical protein